MGSPPGRRHTASMTFRTPRPDGRSTWAGRRRRAHESRQLRASISLGSLLPLAVLAGVTATDADD